MNAKIMREGRSASTLLRALPIAASGDTAGNPLLVACGGFRFGVLDTHWWQKRFARRPIKVAQALSRQSHDEAGGWQGVIEHRTIQPGHPTAADVGALHRIQPDRHTFAH